ncbi:hypothetical protein C1645_840571 [Glomus cerebriforme]|uniref:Uncharacterized protein n=1 Tax=Glomus cerebriforme TaxID=658196 RepID=A0A397S1V8_9GLOM|nr:hypothetical protein C1645_840571 [Glomus cerebriforme]
MEENSKYIKIIPYKFNILYRASRDEYNSLGLDSGSTWESTRVVNLYSHNAQKYPNNNKIIKILEVKKFE